MTTLGQVGCRAWGLGLGSLGCVNPTDCCSTSHMPLRGIGTVSRLKRSPLGSFTRPSSTATSVMARPGVELHKPSWSPQAPAKMEYQQTPHGSPARSLQQCLILCRRPRCPPCLLTPWTGGTAGSAKSSLTRGLLATSLTCAEPPRPFHEFR